MSKEVKLGARMAAYTSLALVSELIPHGGTSSLNDLAARLEMPYSTLRTQLLETIPGHLGFEVMERLDRPGKKDWKLTPAGRELAHRCRILVSTTKAIDAFKPHTKGVIRIGSINAGFRSVVADRLRHIRTTSNIELVELSPLVEITEHVLSGAVDVAFDLIGVGEAHPAEKESHLVTKRDSKLCELVAVATGDLAGDFATKKRANSLASLAVAGTPFIMTATDAASLANSGELTPSMPLITCHTIGAAVSMVERGIGIGILYNFGDLLDRSGLQLLKFENPLRWKIQVITIWRGDNYNWRRELKNDPVIQLIEGP